MRVALSMGRRVFFSLALLFALIALLPLRLALDWIGPASGLSAREAAGSVWLGRLNEARLAGAAIGDLGARLDPLPLVAGRARIDLSRAGEGEPLHGAIGVTRHTGGVDDATGRVPLGQMLAPLPIGALVLNDVNVRFRDGQCDRASGLVRAEIGGAIAGVELPGGLSGTARCESGALLLPLASQSGMESLAFRLSRGGVWTADLRVKPGSAAAGEQLAAMGFAAGAGGYTLSIGGRM